MLGHFRQLKPKNRGSWDGDMRLRSAEFHGNLPTVVAKSRGHYWSASSGFNSFYVGKEVGVRGWFGFGDEGQHRAMDATGKVDSYVLELILQWVFYFGGMKREEPQGHPLCLILPPWLMVSRSTCHALAQSLFTNLGCTHMLFLDSATAVAAGHGVTTGMVVELGREYAWVTPVVNTKALLQHSRRCVVSGVRNEDDPITPTTARELVDFMMDMATQTSSTSNQPITALALHICFSGESPLLADTNFFTDIRHHFSQRLGSTRTSLHPAKQYATLWGAESLLSLEGSRELFVSSAEEIGMKVIDYDVGMTYQISGRSIRHDQWNDEASHQSIPVFKPL
jgi:hypothetical protein